ncbi:MAG: phosphoglycerate dehydrogenase [Verrucomicrobiota bacterium]|jgi:D-3-phosphoglycerate dehydrogenase|nr:phosphoglycerate dehydrogenase [Verrucomicrobiota bacterium]MEC8655839.1 phosphoglycerate dehydrogenase [Verrucomicrobiota bacterium]MEC8865434.1 phosphoglycerate dehydrogenase [Verrucomicrobiota bacterium]MED5281140.1 phosphoglycerate dehydrogenase [Verrucomicrobiota bacterium]|tara:strand:- start:4062 stop:5036 length:975 start_codon:yes stop_codon:yes gene_type:complete
MKILLTTTSFQDTPGPHHQILEDAGFEIIRERGPLPEKRMLDLVGDIDAFLCGDDEITSKVIDRALPRLKVVSKYGIGLDKIDVEYLTDKGVPLTFCPGVNHTTVSEHTFALMLALFRKLVKEANHVAKGEWVRVTGNEIMGKTLSIIGLGRIGKEVAIRANAFGMKVIGYDLYWDEDFARGNQIIRAKSIDEALEQGDVVSLHVNLSDETRELINRERLSKMKDGVVILNCARGEIIHTQDVIDALHAGKIGGYGTDVLDVEPPPPDHPMLNAPNTVITPHIGSRTFESVERQATMAARNLVLALRGETPLAQANDAPLTAHT